MKSAPYIYLVAGHRITYMHEYRAADTILLKNKNKKNNLDQLTVYFVQVHRRPPQKIR
jgi:hypothetical protein